MCFLFDFFLSIEHTTREQCVRASGLFCNIYPSGAGGWWWWTAEQQFFVFIQMRKPIAVWMNASVHCTCTTPYKSLTAMPVCATNGMRAHSTHIRRVYNSVSGNAYCDCSHWTEKKRVWIVYHSDSECGVRLPVERAHDDTNQTKSEQKTKTARVSVDATEIELKIIPNRTMRMQSWVNFVTVNPARLPWMAWTRAEEWTFLLFFYADAIKMDSNFSIPNIVVRSCAWSTQEIFRFLWRDCNRHLNDGQG